MDENKKRIRPAGTGFLFMIIACVVYLIWWFVNYYPDSPYSNFLGNTVGMVIWEVCSWQFSYCAWLE
jgi:hypothetical protein